MTLVVGNDARARERAPRQRIWDAVRRIRANITSCRVAQEADVTVECARAYLQALGAGGFLRNIGSPAGNVLKLWELVRDTGAHAPRLTLRGEAVTVGAGNRNMWQAMHILQDFSPVELAEFAFSALRTAQAYITALVRAGYLVQVRKAIGGRGTPSPARYRMPKAKWTGMHPPVLQKDGSVYDANLGRVVWQPEARCDTC
ncbi:hypothetical protein [Burkholderia sp. RS02]|uniref:hypothetical protein n=1 Tax=unclassified Burkholderia TaxID=2613784 RepID=UPI003218701F